MRIEKSAFRSAAGVVNQDFYSVLARSVEAVSQDHSQLRMLIYEFARTKLRKDLYRQFEEGGWSGIEEQVLALEAAIDQVEMDFANYATPLPFISGPGLTHDTHERSTQTALVRRLDTHKTAIFDDYGVHDTPPFFASSPHDAYTLSLPALTESLPALTEHDDRVETPHFNKQLGSNFWWTIQLIIAVVLGVVIYGAIDDQFAPTLLRLHRFDRPTNISSTNADKKEQNVSPRGIAVGSGAPNIPIPSAYGVYAASTGKLTELGVLPIKVPDQRVAISTLISTPSRAHLPIGQLQFVVFRRDLANDAPDQVAMRVVAQVVRALTFDPKGKATVTNVEGSWVVRGNSYQMKVAPVADNPEMIVIRPEHAEFIFPAGRYALVLKGVAYDFTLDGPIADTAHCLERTDTLNFPIHTECRKP